MRRPCRTAVTACNLELEATIAMICPHCHRTIREEERYLMSVDPKRPRLLGSLRGEGGEGWRIFVTVAVCVLVVLLITGISVAVKQWGG